MRIAILAPLKRELSNETKGGRPRIVYNLVEGLVAKGHEVTVFGTGDSDIHATLIPVIPKALFHLPPVENEFYRHLIALSHMMELLRDRRGEFDILHNHLYPEVLPLLFIEELGAPMLTTVHTQMTPELGEFFSHYQKTYFAPISNRQKSLYPGLNYTQTVYNGIDEKAFSFSGKPGSYLLFVGRIKEGDPKGVADAIRIAKAVQMPLKIIGNVESHPFFEREIKPHLSQTIEFIGDPHSAEGSLTMEERVRLYRGAAALLLPVHWEEPFGIVMIEAMACGTPVIAYRRGAIPEVVEDGVTGFIVDTEAQMSAAVKNITSLDRAACRAAVLEKFTTQKMVSDYEAVYQTIISKQKVSMEAAPLDAKIASKTERLGEQHFDYTLVFGQGPVQEVDKIPQTGREGLNIYSRLTALAAAEMLKTGITDHVIVGGGQTGARAGKPEAKTEAGLIADSIRRHLTRGSSDPDIFMVNGQEKRVSEAVLIEDEAQDSLQNLVFILKKYFSKMKNDGRLAFLGIGFHAHDTLSGATEGRLEVLADLFGIDAPVYSAEGVLREISMKGRSEISFVRKQLQKLTHTTLADPVSILKSQQEAVLVRRLRAGDWKRIAPFLEYPQLLRMVLKDPYVSRELQTQLGLSAEQIRSMEPNGLLDALQKLRIKGSKGYREVKAAVFSALEAMGKATGTPYLQMYGKGTIS